MQGAERQSSFVAQRYYCQNAVYTKSYSAATTTTATTALDLTAQGDNFGATTTLNEVSDRPQQSVGKNRYQN